MAVTETRVTTTDQGKVRLEFRISTEECAQLEIAFLREYHTCLIADVVTGKVDVCAAQGLPDEVEEMEPFDEMVTLAEAEQGIELTEENEEAGG